MALTLEEMKANRRKWVEALRSGEYPQGRGALCNDYGYCCLGVAACVMGIDDARIRIRQNDVYGEVRAFLGLREDLGNYSGGEYASLARANDSGSVSFLEIADIIESEPEGLFVAPQVGAI